MHLIQCDGRVLSSATPIGVAVRDMLAACDVFEPPTPIARLLEYRSLTLEARTALIPSRFQRLMRRVHHKIRGLVDLRERHIEVDATLHPRRRDFITLHEVGHDVLDWHRELFIVTSEWDLRPDVRRLFEAEANCFAALALFQVDHFRKSQRGHKLALANLAGIAARYGASLTATARQYVSVQDLPTALILGRPTKTKSGRSAITFYSGIANAAFLEEFSSELFGLGFNSRQPATAVLNSPGVTIAEEERQVTDRRAEPRVLVVETLYNGYDTFTLVHPKSARARRLGWLRALAS